MRVFFLTLVLALNFGVFPNLIFAQETISDNFGQDSMSLTEEALDPNTVDYPE